MVEAMLNHPPQMLIQSVALNSFGDLRDFIAQTSPCQFCDAGRRSWLRFEKRSEKPLPRYLKTSLTTFPNFTLARSRSFCTRLRSLLAAVRSLLRRRVRSRKTTTLSGGTKLPRTSPTRSRSASHRLSSASVFSPRRALT